MNIHVWNDTENEQSWVFYCFLETFSFSVLSSSSFFFHNHRKYLEKKFKFRDALFFVIILPVKCKHWDEKQKRRVWRIAIFIEKDVSRRNVLSFFGRIKIDLCTEEYCEDVIKTLSNSASVPGEKEICFTRMQLEFQSVERIQLRHTWLESSCKIDPWNPETFCVDEIYTIPKMFSGRAFITCTWSFWLVTNMLSRAAFTIVNFMNLLSNFLHFRTVHFLNCVKKFTLFKLLWKIKFPMEIGLVHRKL